MCHRDFIHIHQQNERAIFMNKQSITKSQKSKQAGFTAIELGIVLVVIGVIAVLALRGTSLVSSSKGVVMTQNVLDSVRNVNNCFAKATNFTLLGATATTGTTYVTANCPLAINPPASVSGSTIINEWSGARTIAKVSFNGGTDNAIVVTDSFLPAKVCQELVSGVWGDADALTVTNQAAVATVVKANAAVAFAPSATAACGSVDGTTVAITKAKY